MKKNYALIGTFDLLHTGHINLMYRTSKLGNVHVLVTSDRLNVENINKEPLVLNENIRLDLVKSLVFVNEAVIFDPLERGFTLEEYFKENNIAGIVYGSDYINDSNRKNMALKNNIEFIIFDRTEGVSSTELREILSKYE